MSSLFIRLFALLGLLMIEVSAHQEIRTTIITVAQTPAPLQAMTPTIAVRTEAMSVVKVIATQTQTRSPLAAVSGYHTTPHVEDKTAASDSRVLELHAAGVSFKDPGFVALTLAFGLISFGMMFI